MGRRGRGGVEQPRGDATRCQKSIRVVMSGMFGHAGASADVMIPGAVRLDVRLSPEDHARVMGEAARRRLTASAYVRQALLGRLDAEHDRDGRAIAALARETGAQARALVEIIVEAIRNALETLGRTVTDEEAKTEQQRLLRWYASAVEDHLRGGRGT